MKKLTIILLTTILGACSSPPDPVPFPKNQKETGIAEFTKYKEKNIVPLDRFNNYEWSYYIISQERYLKAEDNTKFWYLAHHANQIKLSGEIGNITRLKQRLISNGSTAKIDFVDSCIATKIKSCPKTVSIHFAKVLTNGKKTSSKEL
ncbi:hypothetical protein CBE90_04660 [Pasteurella multocida]|uniref:cag pathogenicity island Cag12 family protein n=1 Tax=Pasteurella multocida TaxID=747 RepID=UPI000CE8FE43|nr:cag pathogenicity island Cag12 family protein [Pasteurella multocida]PPE94930.1 hypothetical protein CBE90_04660 [Pasteurella multocida]PPE95050.1 hypothetical protein CBE91_10185 [Pasteurella multocida]HDR1236506.1 hypothetical protein [Pasteurella multocida]HDR1500991.1 hypothetical protein [Pasteurella multocida]